MSEELKITKEKVIEASKKCPEAKNILLTLFPQAFEYEKKDITTDLNVKIYTGPNGYHYLVFELNGRAIMVSGDILDGHKIGEIPLLLLSSKPQEYDYESRETGDFKILKKEPK